MDAKTRAKIDELLSDPYKLRMVKPYTRGICETRPRMGRHKPVSNNEYVEATLPNMRKYIVTLEELEAELDPFSHKCLFDDNIPSITVKSNKDGYLDIEHRKMAVPYQRLIRDSKVMHLCGNKMQFTLMNTTPTEKQRANFTTFKQYWEKRNMDGNRTKMVSAQLSYGIAGMLFYFDYRGSLKARVLTPDDGYVFCPHNDENGDRILESIYYCDGSTEYIDSYDDEYMYRYVLGEGDGDDGWKMLPPVKHGFSEIPLITKRGLVAWDSVQSLIEMYEILYNVFIVIQKRHGWGILYVKGRFKQLAQQIAGAIILNDTSTEGNGEAEYKNPPSPENMIDTLELLEEAIQKGSGTTILLPKDVNSTGDISAQAIMLTQSLDIKTASQGVIEWQNVADKMCRLFKEGIGMELVAKGINEVAVTDFTNGLDISAKFKYWRPQNDSDYNSMLIQLKGAGLISEETGIEKNTESSPDEKSRRDKEKAEEAAAAAVTTNPTTPATDNNNNQQIE